MNPLLINHLIGFSLIAVVLPSIAAIVYLKRPKHVLNRIFSLYTMAISWWAFFTIFMILSPTPGWGLFWDRMCLSGTVFIPSTFFHFMSAYTKNNLRLRIFVKINYFISILFLSALWFTDLFVKGVRPKFGMNYFTVPGDLYFYFIVFFIVDVILVMFYLWRFVKQASHAKIRKQASFLFWFSLIGYSGGSCNYLLVYDLNLPGVAETSNYGVLILSLSIAYIIFRYRFLDIEVIIKKTLVFTGLFGMAMAIVGVVTSLTQGFVAQYLKVGSTLSTGMSVLVAILLYGPTRKILVNLTDRYLFQKRESIKIILNRLSSSIITILDIDKVAETILLTFRDSLRVESGCIILKDDNNKAFSILHSFDVQTATKQFPIGDPFLSYLSERSDWINLEDEDPKGNLPSFVSGTLEQLRAVLCIPLFLHDELIGVLTLGKKRSDQVYSQEEIDYLPTVASQAAIALSNARLYHILMKSQADFAQQAKMAAIGTLAAGISHEIKNPLQIIKGSVEALNLNKRFGFYQNLSKEEYEGVVGEAIDRILSSVARATGVIDRLLGFARKPKEPKVEPMSVEKSLDRALDFLKSEFEKYSIEVKRNYGPDVPDALGDMHAVEEAFLNILVNARHAIGEKGSVTISTCRHNDEVKVSIEDSGHGIAPENLEKIFDPFFTTKDTTRGSDPSLVKGTGLGLFIVRETIRKFGGTIAVESEVGKGTTFHIYLPVSKQGVALSG